MVKTCDSDSFISKWASIESSEPNMERFNTLYRKNYYALAKYVNADEHDEL